MSDSQIKCLNDIYCATQDIKDIQAVILMLIVAVFVWTAILILKK